MKKHILMIMTCVLLSASEGKANLWDKMKHFWNKMLNKNEVLENKPENSKEDLDQFQTLGNEDEGTKTQQDDHHISLSSADQTKLTDDDIIIPTEVEEEFLPTELEDQAWENKDALDFEAYLKNQETQEQLSELENTLKQPSLTISDQEPVLSSALHQQADFETYADDLMAKAKEEKNPDFKHRLFAAAFDLYQRALDQRHSNSAAIARKLGNLYEKGQGVEKSTANADLLYYMSQHPHLLKSNKGMTTYILK